MNLLKNKSGEIEEHYKKLFERHLAESERYQAMLYHAWIVIRQQQKGLRRQANKIKRLQQNRR